MPEYLSPGVYIEEVNKGPSPIEGVGTAVAAFVGFAPSGPANTPMLITNWSQFVQTFGKLEAGGKLNPHLPGAFLSHAVYGYFTNGGGRCYVTRVVGSSAASAAPPAPAQIPSKASKAIPAFTVQAKGNPANDIQVDVTPPGGDDAPEGVFNLKVKMGDIEEAYEHVSLGAGGKVTTAQVTTQSQLITIVEAKAGGALATKTPSAGTYVLATQVTAVTQVGSKDFEGSAMNRSGVNGLEVAEDVTMLACPDLMSAYLSGAIDKDGVKAVQLAMINHCEAMKDRMAIIDPLPDLTPQQVKAWREKDTNYDSKFAALYYPWLKVAGPDGKPMLVPPSGHMAGIFARSDNERGVHKAPANEVVRGALEAAIQITKGEQDTLNPIGVNCIRSFTGRGLRVWGARTLSSEPAWRYVNVRRLFNYVEKSIERGTQWVVFEPNDPDLWARVKRDVGAFLTGVWRSGALFGTTADQAFYVKCDEELNPADVRDRGQLVIEVGMSPVKPAEFVIFRFSQWSGGGA